MEKKHIPVFPYPEHCLNLPLFRIISKVSKQFNVPAYVVGGFVRDCVLKRDNPSMDIDIVVVGKGIEMARETARKLTPRPKVSIFRNFGTAMFRYKNMEVDFVGARKESYRKDSRKPVVEDGSLEDDQKRRDFTINAMAIALHPASYGQFIDPFNGMNDLQNKIVRTPLDPNITFSDDPLRMLRAIRFATQLHFRIAPDVFDAMKQNHERIRIVSMERIVIELNKIMMSNKPSTGFLLLDQSGLLKDIFPELDAMKGVETRNNVQHKDVFLHTIQVLDNISRKTDNLWLRWAALLHDIAKPATKKFIQGQGWTFHGHEYLGSKMVPKIFRRLKLPMNEKMKYVQKLVALHLRPIALTTNEVTDSAVRRLLFEAGNDIDDLMTLCEADITSKNEKKVRQHLENFQLVREKLKTIEEKDAVRNFQPPVTGQDIMKTFGIPPSRKIGILKDAIKEAILEGTIRNDRKEAYLYMIEQAEKLGMEVKNNLLEKDKDTI
ncbi:MAG: HD domain-containing protein [Bacteroidales bacterium]|nr:HD domain-containing protein [Bacteroidales bacterium]